MKVAATAAMGLSDCSHNTRTLGIFSKQNISLALVHSATLAMPEICRFYTGKSLGTAKYTTQDATVCWSRVTHIFTEVEMPGTYFQHINTEQQILYSCIGH